MFYGHIYSLSGEVVGANVVFVDFKKKSFNKEKVGTTPCEVEELLLQIIRVIRELRLLLKAKKKI